jgi:hypothetical protein
MFLQQVAQVNLGLDNQHGISQVFHMGKDKKQWHNKLQHQWLQHLAQQNHLVIWVAVLVCNFVDYLTRQSDQMNIYLTA